MRLYTIKQLAEETNVPVSMLYQLRAEGKLKPALKRGRSMRYTMEAFEEACRATLPTEVESISIQLPDSQAYRKARERGLAAIKHRRRHV
jgi:hypothetical protein